MNDKLWLDIERRITEKGRDFPEWVKASNRELAKFKNRKKTWGPYLRSTIVLKIQFKRLGESSKLFSWQRMH